MWWLAGAIIVLAGLWAGPEAWAKDTGTCGEGTVPGPCGVNDGAGILFDTPTVINVLANDLDRLGQGLSVTGVSTATNGIVTINPGGAALGASVTYTPASGFNGIDRFSYSLMDAVGVGAQAEVVVVVAPAGKTPPLVGAIEPNRDNQLQFTQTVSLPGGSAPITVGVQAGPGTFQATPGVSDTLAIVISTVQTPTGPVTGTMGAVQASSADAGGIFLFLRYANLTLHVDALLNRQSLQQNFLNKPMTLTVSLDEALLPGLNGGALEPLHWNGSAWTDTGIEVVQRVPGSNQVSFTIDRVIGELSFFTRQEAEILMPQIRALNLPPVN
jgi:hypothetical protein